MTNKKTQLTRAVKLIPKNQAEDNNLFLNELSLLKTVDHPHIIRLYECYVDSHFYYLVEEYCSGGDLYLFLRRQKHFSEKQAASVMYQLLRALNYLHSKCIVHRDLKPENIVFTNNNNEIYIKLIDFGISILHKAHETLSQELGTIYYIAPEVLKGNYNEKADIWSAGIILYILLTGIPPFRGNKPDDIRNQILNSKHKIEFNQKEWENISNDAKEFIVSLLQRDPNVRMNAREALKNKWLNEMLSDNKHNDLYSVDLQVINNLTKFSSSITLQKVALSYISLQMGHGDDTMKLSKEFDKIDTNKDGVISKEELIECLCAVYPKQEAVKIAEKTMNEIDFNNDGSINYNEFIAVNMKKEEMFRDEMLRKAFHMFDLDGNGYITSDELKETIPIELNNKLTWKDLIKEVDTDGDEQISFDEFKQMMNKISLIGN